MSERHPTRGRTRRPSKDRDTNVNSATARRQSKTAGVDKAEVCSSGITETKKRIRADTLAQAFVKFRSLEKFRSYPLKIRTYFQDVADWLPDREAYFPVTYINASFAKRLRDKAARARGWKFGNYALILLQILISNAAETGAIAVNRVRQVPKLPPPPLPASTCRRRIRPFRQPISSPVNPLKKENSSA
jgi:hypothetical protein